MNFSPKMLKRIVFLFIAYFILQYAEAQRIVTGRILDMYNKEPVENAVITIYKSTKTTLSNERGYFQVELHNEDSLLITHQNYKSGFLNIPENDVFVVYVEPYDSSPNYLEGIANLYQYLQQSLVYPNSARMKRIEGVLLIEVIVGQDGKMKSCRCLNEIGGNCEKTALKVFNEIPGSWSASTEPKSLIFPLIYVLGEKKEVFKFPDIEFPHGKMMERIIIQAFINY